MKGIILMVITNIAVVVLLSIVASIFGANQTTLSGLIIFALIFGMGGAFISLAISKWSAKMMVGAEVIENPRNSTEQWLLETVQQQAKKSGIGMPEVAIYDSPDMNAFATGMNRNNALVAVSTGLLNGMNKDEVEAVLAHEISHVANGDMVAMTLVQGVVNTFVILLARLVGHFVDGFFREEGDDSSAPGLGYYITSIVAEIVFGILAMPIVMWFSRLREFRADAGAAKLEGANKMIHALQRLQQAHTGEMPAQMSAFGIHSSQTTGIIQQLFSSHPSIDDRIAALRQQA